MRVVNGRAAVSRASRTRIDIGFTGVLLVGMNVVAGVIIWGLWRGLRVGELGVVPSVLVGVGVVLFVVGLVGMTVQSVHARWGHRRHTRAAAISQTTAVETGSAPAPVDVVDATVDVAPRDGEVAYTAVGARRTPTIRLRDHRIGLEPLDEDEDGYDGDLDDELDDDVAGGEAGAPYEEVAEDLTGGYSGFYDEFDDEVDDDVVAELDSELASLVGLDADVDDDVSEDVGEDVSEDLEGLLVGADDQRSGGQPRHTLPGSGETSPAGAVAVEDADSIAPPVPLRRRTHIPVGRSTSVSLHVAEPLATLERIGGEAALELDRLRGLGATMQERLAQLGYPTQRELAGLDDAVLEDVAAELGTFPGRLTSWVTQARRNVERTPDQDISRTA